VLTAVRGEHVLDRLLQQWRQARDDVFTPRAWSCSYRSLISSPFPVLGGVRPRRVHGHTEPLDQATGVALVPRAGEHDCGLSLGRNALELTGRGIGSNSNRRTPSSIA
jgi:hypothetical protein